MTYTVSNVKLVDETTLGREKVKQREDMNRCDSIMNKTG